MTERPTLELKEIKNENGVLTAGVFIGGREVANLCFTVTKSHLGHAPQDGRGWWANLDVIATARDLHGREFVPTLGRAHVFGYKGLPLLRPNGEDGYEKILHYTSDGVVTNRADRADFGAAVIACLELRERGWPEDDNKEDE